MDGPPYARIIRTRSLLSASGMRDVNLRPNCAQTSAMAMLGPAGGFITEPPGFNGRWRTAFPRMCRAILFWSSRWD